MIQINLLASARKKKAAGAGLSMPDFGELFKAVKDPLLLATVGAWVVAVVFCAVVWSWQSAKLGMLEPRVQEVRAESRRFRALIRDKRRMEALRDSLVAELQAIREIDSDRYVWPHVLEEVTKALPDFTWLVGLDAMAAPGADEGGDVTGVPVRFALDGRTSDLQAFTRFQRQLANSPWLTSIQFGQTQQVFEQERTVRAFRIQATFREADSSFIRTAPVTRLVQ